ncbi:hypothetical protein [Amycolatopsis sp. NPDC051061]|uniref:hypothetical protein n=1 Tax=Amycolatopsis sp. NPDC051061 TaxID=3155042 RepID=UPI00342ED751
MTSRDDGGVLVLLPTVAIDDVLDEGPPWLGEVDPEALAVQSVLLPVKKRSLGNRLRFRFAHQAFHEFFLAFSLRAKPDDEIEAAAPPEVVSWLREMRSSDLF